MPEIVGLIGFCTTRNSIVAKLIRFFRKDFVPAGFIPSHTFVIFSKIGDELILGESTDPFMRLYPLSKYTNDIDRRIELWEVTDITTLNKMQAVSKMMPFTGKTYGYLQLVGYVWIWMGKKLGFKASNPIDDKDEMPCAEYAWLFLKHAGHSDQALMSMNQNDIAPDTLLTNFENSSKCRKAAVKEYDSSELVWIIDDKNNK